MRPLLVALALVTSLAAALLALVLLPLTETGTRMLANLAQSVSDLEIEHESGALLGQLRLRRIRVPTEDAVVELRDLGTRIDRDCLLRGEICFIGLNTAFLNVEVLLTDDESADNPLSGDRAGGTNFLPLPFEVFAPGLSIDGVRVHWNGGEITSTHVEGDATVLGERIEIAGLTAHATRLFVPDDGEEPATGPLKLPEVELPVELFVEDAILYDSRWEIYEVSNQYDELEVSGYWVGTRMTISSGRLLNRQWGEATLHGVLDYVHPYQVQTEVDFETTTPPLWEGLHGAPGQFSLGGSLAALSLEGRVCGGELPVVVEAEMDIVSREWPLSLKARGGCEQLPATIALNEVTGMQQLPGWSVADGWSLSLVGDFERQQIAVEGQLVGDEYGPLRVTARGLHQSGRVLLRELLASRRTETQILKLAGELGYGDLLRWDLLADLDSLQLPPALMPVSGELNGTLRTRGEAAGEAWQVEISQADIEGSINELPANISGTLRLNHELNFDGSDLDIAAQGLRLRIVDRVGQPPRAFLAVEDAADWVEGASGDLLAELQWQRDTSVVSITADSEGLAWDAISLNRFTLNGHYDYAPDEEELSLEVSSSGAGIGELAIDSLELTLEGNPNRHKLRLRSDGDIQTTLTLDGALAEGGWRGRLQPLSLIFPAGSWELDREVDIDFLEETRQLSFAPHCWREGEADLCIDQFNMGQNGAARMELEGDLKRISQYLPERYRIQAPLRATLETRWEELAVQEIAASLEIAGGELRQDRLIGEWTTFAWERLLLNYQGDRENGRLLGSLRQGGEESLAVDLNMPSALDGQLSGEMVLRSVELQAFENFIDELGRLRGKVAGTLQFGGQVQRPEINGSIALRDGLATLARSPTSLENVSLEARFRGRFAEFGGQASVGGGSSNLEGILDWREQPRLSLALKGDEKKLSIPPTTELTVAENLLLEISAARFSLTGELNVPRGKFVLEELPQDAVEVSDDVVLYDGMGKPLYKATPTLIDMDVRINIADQFRVSTDGLAGRVGGELTLRRRPGKPLQVFGGMGVIEGRFDLLGPRFEVERGSLSFVGVPDNPQLDIVLERQITEDQVTVGIRVGGNLNLPQLDFYSRPSLPEEEVMAYVLGGRGIDRTGESDSLALALAATSGLMQSKGLLKGISLGVEGRDRRARAAIGGYISDRLYMSYGIGLYQPVNTMTVRMDILRNFWLEVVSGLENSADMYYAWTR